MAPPKRKRAEKTSPPLVDPEGMFKGMTVFLVPKGIQNSRLQIWKHKLLQMGAIIEDKFRTSVTHVLGMNLESILQELDIDKLKNFQGLSLLYSPPDLNRNITEIFGRLINVYRALGDDRRSFSYYKAIPVIEKLPFKIESIDQVEHLPGIGKALKDHIQEIVSTGKLSKLEHFEKDEKVRTITLFGEIWGIGPATALKFYEKGHRTLEDLSNEKSLSHAQRLGLQYFDDIRAKIPRKQVSEMEMLLTKTGEDILPGVIIVCGGSYRRGKAFCGDLDIVITHPNGISHKGFLAKYVKYLKDIKFLREDLVFSVHSDEGTDSGVDTYFGLCTEPGQEQRHRIDLKVYPRDIYAFGLIAWTGNDVLNRRLRLLAESKGYRLDDTGLFVATQGSPGKRGMKSSATIHCNSEREVFDFLGFPWLEPHQRNL
ncbi:DNA polymerase lambda (POLL) isoform X2 [Wolffia australiana]